MTEVLTYEEFTAKILQFWAKKPVLMFIIQETFYK